MISLVKTRGGVCVLKAFSLKMARQMRVAYGVRCPSVVLLQSSTVWGAIHEGSSVLSITTDANLDATCALSQVGHKVEKWYLKIRTANDCKCYGHCQERRLLPVEPDYETVFSQ